MEGREQIALPVRPRGAVYLIDLSEAQLQQRVVCANANHGQIESFGKRFDDAYNLMIRLFPHKKSRVVGWFQDPAI